MTRSLQLVVGLSLLSSAARAQRAGAQDSVRLRYWADIGLGAGSSSFSCDACDYRRALGKGGTRRGGWTLALGLGVAPNPRARLGIVYDGWLNGLKAGDSLPTLDLFTLMASYSLQPGRGPFIEGGWGFSHYGLEQGTGDPIEPLKEQVPAFAAGSGQTYQLGVGWKTPRGFMMRMAYVAGRQRVLHAAGDGTVATGWKERMLLVVAEFRTPEYRKVRP
jgi:hypothetical protein